MASVPEHIEGAAELQSTTTVAEFPVGYFVENIAVRSSGPVLVTVFNKSELWQVDPSQAKPTSILVYTFPVTISGIVEVEHDVFYVSAGYLGSVGSFSIYRVDMSSFSASASGEVENKASVSKAIDLPEASFLNGSTLLNREHKVFLAADSFLGLIYQIDLEASKVSVWLKDKTMDKFTENPMLPGINGIKIFNGALYFSNTDSRKIFRVGLTGAGAATGKIELVEDGLNADDFAFDTEGSAYFTTHFFNSVVKLQSNGTRTAVAGGAEDVVVAGTTAAAFGRTKADKTHLYVTTNGGMSSPVNGEVGPARLLSIDVGHEGAFDQFAK